MSKFVEDGSTLDDYVDIIPPGQTVPQVAINELAPRSQSQALTEPVVDVKVGSVNIKKRPKRKRKK